MGLPFFMTRWSVAQKLVPKVLLCRQTDWCTELRAV
jgi:hypothetical protein